MICASWVDAMLVGDNLPKLKSKGYKRERFRTKNPEILPAMYTVP